MVEKTMFLIVQILNIIFLTIIFDIFFQRQMKTTLKGHKIFLKTDYRKYLIDKVNTYVKELNKIKCFKSKMIKVTPISFILISILIALVIFIISFILIRVVSTAFIISAPFLLVPVLFVKTYNHKEKYEILKTFPTYIINLKNYIELENNIIKAIQKTPVEQPLKKYIDKFNLNINKGIPINKAFILLKENINIKQINLFVNVCQVCYFNGGKFDKVLKKYLQIVTKENVEREKMKEDAYGSILVLIVMLIINLILIFTFVFKNQEYSLIIKNTFIGKMILNFNVISYYIIGLLISKIYIMEE